MSPIVDEHRNQQYTSLGWVESFTAVLYLLYIFTLKDKMTVI